MTRSSVNAQQTPATTGEMGLHGVLGFVGAIVCVSADSATVRASDGAVGGG